jgi:putative copper resistance protein D
VPAYYYICVTIHLLAAFLWLGGMLFLAAVGAPVLRTVEPPELRQRLFHLLGTKFRAPGWMAIATLLVTGTINLHARGFLRWDGVLGTRVFWTTGIGMALAVKLLAVVLLVVMSAVHDFVVGPAAGRAVPGSPEAIALRKKTARLGRLSAVTGLLLIMAAVRLTRGG